MQQDIHTTLVEVTRKHSLTIETEVEKVEERQEDSAQEKSKVLAPSTKYRMPRKEEYACW